VTTEVARVRDAARKQADAARSDPASATGDAHGQLALGLGTPEPVAAPADTATASSFAIPATVALRADALQVARFESLVEQARKRGLVPAKAGRMELVLAALERWVAGEAGEAGEAAANDTAGPGRSRGRSPRAAAQVIVHQCPTCAAATVTTAGGERPLAPAQVAVLARDRHRCTTPGCGATAFLEVHHVVPRGRGGSNRAGNLVTLCGRCHAFAHAEGVAPAQVEVGVRTSPASP
jgi:5-methylcytosine-specific restriction endonuclease McrA